MSMEKNSHLPALNRAMYMRRVIIGPFYNTTGLSHLIKMRHFVRVFTTSFMLFCTRNVYNIGLFDHSVMLTKYISTKCRTPSNTLSFTCKVMVLHSDYEYFKVNYVFGGELQQI
jgi:hypothetical protein